MGDKADLNPFNQKGGVSRREFMAQMTTLGVSMALVPSFLVSEAWAAADMEKLTEIAQGIVWTGQASMKIPGLGSNVYVDPYKVKDEDKADIVLITHSHDDHLSVFSLKKICHDQTTIIAPKDVASKIKSVPKKEVVIVKPGDKVSVGSLSVEAVPMYNVKKTKYHAKSKNWVGYVMTANGISIYHAGDTERIPEMKNIRCDLALLPLGQKYTMNSVEEAAEAAKDVGARIAVPMHYGMKEGSKKDAVKFKELLAGHTDVVILERVS